MSANDDTPKEPPKEKPIRTPPPLTRAEHRTLILSLSLGIPALVFFLLATAILFIRYRRWRRGREPAKEMHSPFHKKNTLKSPPVHKVERVAVKVEEGNEAVRVEEGRSSVYVAKKKGGKGRNKL